MFIDKNFLLKTSVLLVVAGCSKAQYRANQEKMSSFYTKKDYVSAKKLATDEEFLPEKENVLLKNLEQGSGYLYNDNACSALYFYDKAEKIATDQQTKSIKDGINTAITEADGIYYGQTYEQSLMNFYRSLANYKVYKSGICDISEIKKDEEKNAKKDSSKDKTKIKDEKDADNSENQTKIKQLSEQEKTTFLRSSRANVLLWDSWMKGRTIEKNDRLYMDDLLLKLWGAFIHEQNATAADLQIAKQLYKDAQDVAKKRYAVYNSFNGQNRDFIANIDNQLKREQSIDGNNTYTNDLIEYTNQQIQRIEKKRSANLAIIIHDGTIAPKVAKESISPLGVAAFALNPDASIMSSVLGINTLTYEKPEIKNETVDYKYYYSLWKNNVKVLEKPLILAEPISNIAYENLQEKINDIIVSTQAKVAKQIVIGLAASYTTYIAFKDNDLLALTMPLAVYAGYSQVIRNAGIVDTRQWVSLPSNIFMAINNIKNDKYKLQIVRRKNSLNQQVDKGVVNAKQEEIVYSKDVEINNDTTFIDVRL